MKKINVFVVAMIAIFLSSCAAEEKKKEEKAKDPLVVLEAATIEKFTHEIRVQGTVETEFNSMLSAEMGGTITSINVKEGDKVKKGQSLIVIDASILSANAVEIETQLDYARYMLEKQEELKERGVGTEFELETAKNQVKALESKLNSLQTQRGKSLIKAPFSGTIDQIFASKGQIAGPQAPLLRIVNNKEVDIVSMISEKYLSSIKVGTELSVDFPNYGDTTIKLKVTNVGNYIEPANRTFRIRANVKGNEWLLPNMLAEVKVTDLVVENGLVIPAEAILKDGENKDYVLVALEKDKKLISKRVSIQLISRHENKALIVNDGSIQEGDQIITKGARGIEEGDKIRIK